MEMTNWYIDAWSIRDGAAFASRRQPKSRDAENTVFIAVPDLEPVPVGRLSTALSATRRCFQAGLWNEDENEAAFESIEQVAELVRRGFLAGGLGPGGAASPTPGFRPRLTGGDDEGGPPQGDGGGAQHFEEAISTSVLQEWHWKEAGDDIHHALENLAQASSLGGDERPALSFAIRSLLSLCYKYAEAITMDWESRVIQNGDAVDTKMLLSWYQALVQLGVWSNEKELSNFVTKYSCPAGMHLTLMWFGYTRFAWPNLADCAPHELLNYAPCPRRESWIEGLTRLSDKVMLPMCVADYFETNHDLPEWAPCVLGAMLLNSASFPSAFLSGEQFRNARLASAFRWVAGEIPHVSLPPEIEQLITNYAWDRFASEMASDLAKTVQ